METGKGVVEPPELPTLEHSTIFVGGLKECDVAFMHKRFSCLNAREQNCAWSHPSSSNKVLNAVLQNDGYCIEAF